MTPRLTPQQWGRIPKRCDAWPWSYCPDCRRRPGELHTDLCGALDDLAPSDWAPERSASS